MSKGLITTEKKLRIGGKNAQVNQRIERKLFTTQRSVLGKMEIGSVFLDFFYEEATLDNAREMLRIVEEIVNEETEILVDSITASYTNLNGNNDSFGILIKIDYHFPESPEIDEEAVFFRIKRIQ